MELDIAYLLELAPDRLLHRFHLNAGLPPKGDLYGGWESQGVSGHTLGHYLSALALGYAATGDQRLLEKLNYTIDELALCQEARKSGYVGGIPGEDSVFADIKRGGITSAGFDLNGLWVPWYTIHKVFAGLEDAYLYTGNTKALQITVRLGEWTDAVTANLTADNWQKMLGCEHGGMNEVLANLYAITGQEKFLALSRKFHHNAILDPLSLEKDELAGKHANTQIPKIIGCIRRYELTGDVNDRKIAEFFWQTVVKHHSYVIGGNSNFEHFGHANQLSDQLSESTTETCNTNNMLKLTRHLYSLQPDAAWMDYYERALYNHILASQNPENGMMCYFVPLQSGSEKVYSDKFDSFWCCVGTGIENHVKYGESIYAQSTDGGLYINLFIPSELDWKTNGIKIRQETAFPESDKIMVTITGNPAQKFPVKVRFPAWASTTSIKINGKKQKIKGKPGSFITLKYPWKNGDRIEINFPMHLYTEAIPGKSEQCAVLFGPLVLAGELKNGSDSVAPVMRADERVPAEWLQPVAGEQLTFETKMAGYPRDLRFSPFYKMHGKPYAVYFDFYTRTGLVKYKIDYEARQRYLQSIAARTVDILRTGEMQPERDHQLTGEKTFSAAVGEKNAAMRGTAAGFLLI